MLVSLPQHNLESFPLARRTILAASFGAASLAMPGLSTAQTKPLTLVVAYPTGGGADLMARLIAPHLTKILGQNVVIDNKPGATGQIAAAHVAKAAPDGNTLLLDASPFCINPHLNNKLSYDIDKDFAPIAVLALFPNVLVCHPGFEAKSVKDVIRLAKAAPGKLAYASSGIGSGQHLAGAVFESSTQTQMLHIPYRGGGPALTDVMGGQVPLFFANLAASLGHIQNGKLRALAVTSKLRARSLPDVPSIEQEGVAGFEVLEWNPIVAPAGVSPEVQTKLRTAVKQALDEPEVLARIRALSGEVFHNGKPDQAKNFIAAQGKMWGKVIKEKNISAAG